jgi:hypothetical protein
VSDESVVDHDGEVARHLQLVAAADRDAVDARERRLASLGLPRHSSAHDLRSAPTQKARPTPVTTTTRMSSSHDASSHARVSSRNMRKSNAFSTSGRLSVIVARGGVLA